MADAAMAAMDAMARGRLRLSPRLRLVSSLPAPLAPSPLATPLLSPMLDTPTPDTLSPPPLSTASATAPAFPTPPTALSLTPPPTMVPSTARGPLVLSPAMVVMAMEDVAMAATDATARGRLRLRPAMAVMAMADAAMAAMDAMARGRPSPATDVVAMVATAVAAGTTVELRSKRSELSLHKIDLISMKI